MARAIPALPYLAPDPLECLPALPILSGGAAHPGRWRDLVRAVNLDLATGNAGVVLSQWWPDGSFFVPGPAGVYTPRCRCVIPGLSGYHTAVRCSVFARSASGLGAVRFSSTYGAGVSVIPVPGPLASTWLDTASPHLPVTPSFAPAHEFILVETTDDVEIEGIQIQYLDHDPTGLWPGADGALPAGVVPGSTRLAVPLDDAEADPDKPLASDVGRYCLDALRDLEERPRVYFSAMGFELGHAAGVDDVLGAHPHRVTVPVIAERPQSTSLDVAIYADTTAGALDVYVQRSGREGRVLPPGEDALTLTVPAAGIGWNWFTVDLAEVADFAAPASYPGLTTLAFRPAVALAQQHAKSIAVWGR